VSAPRWTADLISDDQIEALSARAAEEADEYTQALCGRALAGEPGARQFLAEEMNLREAEDNEREPRDPCPT